MSGQGGGVWSGVPGQSGGGCLFRRGLCSEKGGADPPPRWLLQRTVRILLESILVVLINFGISNHGYSKIFMLHFVVISSYCILATYDKQESKIC